MAGKPARAPSAARPWRWVPTVYLGQGVPYVVAMTLSVVMYKNLGVGNGEIALYTSWLYLPWVVKALWSPVVELLGGLRTWIVVLQAAMALALAAVALALPSAGFFQATLALLWLLAFASATHDLAADGFYMQALDAKRQAAFVGVRSTFYRLATIASQGGLVYLAGWLMARGGTPAAAWTVVFAVLAVAFAGLAGWHALALPRPAPTRPTAGAARARPGSLWRDSVRVFGSFFRQPGIARIVAFLLLYRFGEAQLLKLVAPFLLDAPAAGGLGLDTRDLGIVYGTVGATTLTLGGLFGGWLIARRGLRPLLWPLMVCMHLPNLLFVALAAWQPAGLGPVAAVLAIEQFGYGLGFTAYMVFILQVAARGEHATAHYALCTGFMALGMMLPGMAAGWLQERLGYFAFFVWACAASVASFAAAAWVWRDLDAPSQPPATSSATKS